MSYRLIPTPKFIKQFKKLDRFVQKQIKTYLESITENPRAKGKGLVANRSGQWRYRVGDYRIVVNIKDSEMLVLALEVGHRKNVYK